MLNKNETVVINTKILSPFLYFFVSWSIVYVLYNFYWSDLLPKLSVVLSSFIFFSIIINILLYYVSPKVEFTLNLKVNETLKILKRGSVLVVSLFLIEFVAIGTFPLLSMLKGNFIYGSFGLPFVHVMYNAFSSVFCSLSFFYFLATKNKKFIKYIVIFISPGILIVTRSYIMYNLFYFIIIYFTITKFTRKKLLKTFVGFFIFIVIGIMLFGYMGEKRSNSIDIKASNYITELAKPSDKFKKSNLNPALLWVYVYATTPVANLEHTISSEKIKPLTEVDDLLVVFSHFLPDMLKKRLFPEQKKPSLIVPYFNVSTIYSDVYPSLGWMGIFYSFLNTLIIIFFVYYIRKRGSIYSYLSFIYLSTIVFFNMFVNMFNFMGLAPQFWIAILFMFKDDFVLMVKSKEKGELKVC